MHENLPVSKRSKMAQASSGGPSGHIDDEDDFLESEIFDLNHFGDLIPHQAEFAEEGYNEVTLSEFGRKFKVGPFYDKIPFPELHRPQHPLLQAKACWITLMKLYANTASLSAVKQALEQVQAKSAVLGTCEACQATMYASTVATNSCGHSFHIHCLLAHAKANADGRCPLQCGTIDDAFVFHTLGDVANALHQHELRDPQFAPASEFEGAYAQKLCSNVEYFLDLWEHGSECLRIYECGFGCGDDTEIKEEFKMAEKHIHGVMDKFLGTHSLPFELYG